MQPLSELENDFKAEAIAALLLADDPDVSKVIIERLGINSRSHKKDLHHSCERIGHVNLNNYTVFQSFRQSIYEAMPESLFHPPSLGAITMSDDELIEEVRHQRKKESEARLFFKPFEQEGSYIEMNALLLELMLEQKDKFSNLFDLFAESWPIMNMLPKSTALCFAYIVPILHKVRGNREWIEKCLTFLLGRTITISVNYNNITIDDRLPSFTLNASNLGIDSSLPGIQYDGIAEWKISVGPVSKKDVQDVLPHTKFFKLLQTLVTYFNPDFIFERYVILTEKESETFLFPQYNQQPDLGYSFFL